MTPGVRPTAALIPAGTSVGMPAGLARARVAAVEPLGFARAPMSAGAMACGRAVALGFGLVAMGVVGE